MNKMGDVEATEITKRLTVIVKKDLQYEFQKYGIPQNNDTKAAALIGVCITSRVFFELMSQYLRDRGVSLTEIAMTKYAITKKVRENTEGLEL